MSKLLSLSITQGPLSITIEGDLDAGLTVGYVRAIRDRIEDLLDLSKNGVPEGIEARSFPVPDEELEGPEETELLSWISLQKEDGSWDQAQVEDILVEVPSTCIQALTLAHLAGQESGTLFVRFINGGLYAYADVPRNLAEELVNADSIGRFFREHIKGTFPATRIDA